LGSLFCALASANKQLLVETHSDYLIDRIRMDVRDGASEKPLLPEEVSILYFEPLGTHVKIHSIGIDEVGNVVGAPHSYGSFFMAESRRSIGL
jgi:predicted ATPase